ncbi:deoxyribose-phosphate aldolase [Rheinheimera sp. MMS21-TC3]|uniref:deoxyribose-phosphate aldolase n=1 Tax=Rheinheimera sp. MMS21-TC3 TaxID=3072790 RepID=UPI0028C49802|nr:deoxyribose-phosphate aldolase [Rheinheimera sp. MMS21-TC3]WNO60824.1 deoxyribose-phosphate aldolase [Rheinheimera sp. MMS21-TC3]
MTNSLRLQQLVKLVDITRLEDNDNNPAFDAWLSALPKLPYAAYCVYPEYLPVLVQNKSHLKNANLATVVNFPTGDLATDIVCEQIQLAIQAGATEIDCVLPYKALMRGEHGIVKNFLYDIRQACGDLCLKIIIESGELITAQQVAKAAELAIECGADFIKSSTGKVTFGISEEAARIILTVIAAAERTVGFKASGGIRTVEQAINLIQLYEQITGQIATCATMRIGASSLITELVKQLEQST